MEKYKKYLMIPEMVNVDRDEKLAIGFITDAIKKVKKKKFMDAVKTLEAAEEVVKSIAVQYGDMTYK